ncbi:MAG TPA: platelet-activating factor acetylhydrolase IB subunit [Pirellulales bacterium]|nr:platelet-activating factor acetylhydrolase IB subunit [Pirellulales bacterium]
MNRRRLWFAVVAAFTLSAAPSPASCADEPATVKPVPREVGWWKDRNDQFNARAKQGNVDLIFLGDSITQGWEDKAAQPIWDKYFGPRKAMNAGIGGDQTQHVLWRLEHGNLDGIKPKVAVIMIGTNNSSANSSEEIAAGIKAIVERLRKALPETKILLLGIFPRGADDSDPQRKKNIGANEIIKKLEDGKQVHYLDISAKFLDSGGKLSTEIMPDRLHLSARGYEIWAESIDGKLAELLGEK